MTETSPQRAYQAACPGCGAPVSFTSAQSTHAVCGYCHSTVVRQGNVLARIGKIAEVFEDYSPLQLAAAGRYRGVGFSLIGRLQYRAETGTWNEWIAQLDDGRTGSLSEDNGAFVFALPVSSKRDIPEAPYFRLGATTAIDGQSYAVASNTQVALVAAQGELPKLPQPGERFAMVELRSTDGQPAALSLDYSSKPPALSLGTPVRLEELQMTGLRDSSSTQEQARQLDCPNCGAPVAVSLSTSQSVSCPSCHSVIDLREGVGGELRHAQQQASVQPVIALGKQGMLQGVQWQVVGFQHRMGTAVGDDEQFGWSEYLLYNTKRGFCFLVDSDDGWSLVKPTTGAPKLSRDGQSAVYLGTTYKLQYSYSAETYFVAGEFYWPVEIGQRTANQDFASGRYLLSLEANGAEQVWSAGSMLDSDTVAKAFGITAHPAMLSRSDVAPLAALAGLGLSWSTIFWIVVGLVFFMMLTRCDSCDPSVQYCGSGGYRSAGASYGGASSGGGHK